MTVLLEQEESGLLAQRLDGESRFDLGRLQFLGRREGARRLMQPEPSGQKVGQTRPELVRAQRGPLTDAGARLERVGPEHDGTVLQGATGNAAASGPVVIADS